jgi:hypothetical protein
VSSWVIADEPPGSEPIVGAVYEVRHERKGTFAGRAISVRGEWLTLEITDGSARAIYSYNERGEGEQVIVRDVLCRLTRVATASKPPRGG